MRVARPERLAEVVAVQGIPVETWIRDSVLPEISAASPADRWRRAVAAMLQGEKGTPLHLSLKLPGGEMRGISVTRSVSLNDRWPLEPPALEIDSLADGVVVVRLNSLAEEDVVRQFDRAFRDFTNVRGRVVIIGETTAGNPSDAAAFPLPKNWSVQFSVRRDAFPDGVEFVGKGIAPAVPVAVTVGDVLAGRDAALEKARKYVTAPPGSP